MEKKDVITAAVIVAVGAGSFIGGMQYQKRQTPQATFEGGPVMMGQRAGGSGNTGDGGRTFQMRNGAAVGTNGGMRPVSGEIISIDDTSMTVRLPDGSTKLVLLSDSTAVNKTSQGSRSDLTVGETVNALGTENADGSVSAQSVSLGDGGVRMFTQTAPPEQLGE